MTDVIGDGVKGAEKEGSATAEPLKASPQSGKRSTRKTDKSITPAEAVSILQSALYYCRLAHLRIEGYNDGTGFALRIEGVNLMDKKFVYVGVTPEPESHTNEEEVTP